MTHINLSILKEFSYVLWRVSVIAGICVYVALRFVFPSL
ncbi:hypothetical protein GARC_0719 [Paraglaciecola arctica BSs20135]|uniref:Uncharacterized protein n=1 Tax=Paraglaciecola arctica BSs20135 TaxID=493475 RepID=K6Z2L5_9ALTE|nr:hypothetical protein GARC_0719 [Paraglaciecola arctica BSs20135]